MKDEELNEAALFDEVTADEPVEETGQAEQVTETEQTERQPEAGETADNSTETKVDDDAAQVPSWRVREINEEKRRFAEENERMKAELAELRRASQQRQQPQEQQQEQATRPDPLLDPEGYAKQVREDIRNELLAERREESLQNAAEKYGDEFKEAYTAAQQKIDPALRARMQSSRNPGETLIQWHREAKQRAEIGNDLNAYKQRHRDELLKDPEFRKQAMEAWRDSASQSNGSPKVELPPSISGASRARAVARSSDSDDISDGELFEQIAG